MKDNTLVLFALGGLALWYAAKNGMLGGTKTGTEAMKHAGGLSTPLPKGGGITTGPASSTVLQLPGVNNNAEYAGYIKAGADLVNSLTNAYSAYKGATPAASSFVVGNDDTIYKPATGRDGTYYKAV